MNELLAVMIITVLAVISPGPDFAMITRNSYAFGRRAGLASAIGIAFGVQVHVLYTALGIATVLTDSPIIFLAIKTAGAAYLIYLGINALIGSTPSKSDRLAPLQLSTWRAMGMGFLTNALNPKTMLFVIATFTQVVQPNSDASLYIAYGLFISLAHWIWFSIVALFFSNDTLRQRMLSKQGLLDSVIGVALMLLGASLLYTEFQPA